jgi:hypothetical protein
MWPITGLVARGFDKQLGVSEIGTTGEKGVDLRVEFPGDPQYRRRGELVYTEVFDELLGTAGRDALRYESAITFIGAAWIREYRTKTRVSKSFYRRCGFSSITAPHRGRRVRSS